jgi:hypothetical protein
MVQKKSKKKQRISKTWGERLWEGKRKWFTLTPACLLVTAGGWYAYVCLTVIPPPPVEKTPVQKFVDFISNDRGLIQMRVDQRREYLIQAWQYYGNSSQEQQRLLVQSLERLTPGQKEVRRDAAFEVAKSDLLKEARNYQQIQSEAGRQQFLTESIGRLRQTQEQLTGRGTLARGNGGIAAAVGEAVAPKNDGELQQYVLSKSTPGERAVGEPYMNQLIQQNKQLAQGRQPERVSGG